MDRRGGRLRRFWGPTGQGSENPRGLLVTFNPSQRERRLGTSFGSLRSLGFNVRVFEDGRLLAAPPTLLLSFSPCSPSD